MSTKPNTNLMIIAHSSKSFLGCISLYLNPKAYLIALLFVCSAINQTLFSQDTISLDVLFVGNSYTYFWNLPQTVAAMSKDSDVKLITRQSTSGGANLSQHWHYKKSLKTRDKINANEFDVVILQDHSMRALRDPDSLHFYGKLFDKLIKESGAKTYLYMTWSRSWDPFMIEEISSQYERLAQEIGAVLVPVGLAWDMSRKLRPDLDLYDVDQTHPSPEGTYLTACMFYGILTDNSPVGLPERITMRDADGELLYLNIQSEENALFLQKVAERSLSEISKDKH